ncbi:MAG: EAL domain-containing protein [Acidimicrobiia bacterium]|nr:EAL domain-containing protein [Acidimicrobiia bacterium]
MTNTIVLDGLMLPFGWEVDPPALGIALLLGFSVGAVVSVTATTWRVSRAERKRRALERLDTLTGLPNRSAVEEQLATPPAVASVFLVELDRFAAINEAFGREVGDRLVRSVAEHLQALTKGDELLGRWTGSQFLLLSPSCTTHDDAARRATEITEALSAVARIGVDHIRVSVTVGGAVIGHGDVDLPAALEGADMALAIARNAGFGSTEIFDRTKARPLSTHEADERLRRALADDHFSIMYTPIVSLEELGVAGVSTTLHLADAAQGIVTPAIVRALVEQSNLQREVAIHLLDRVVPQAAHWARRHESSDPVTLIELTPTQMIDPEVAAHLTRLLDEHDLDPGNICLVLSSDEPFELTTAWGPLRELKAAGVLVGIDNFGEGWASLAFLRRMAVDVVRFGPGVTESMSDGRSELAIASQFISLIARLELIGIASGVTDEVQRTALHGVGCNLAQGPWFGRATTAAGIDELLDRGKVKPGKQRRGIDWKAPTTA